MIVIRTEASPKTGFGHLKRCVYLASLFGKRNAVRFLVNKDKSVSRFLEDLGTPFLYHTPKEIANLKHEEIKFIIFDLRDFSPEDIQFLNWAREKNIKTIQITDLGLSQQPVDVTFDGSAALLHPYAPEKCVFSGSDYALLHHQFRHFNKVRRLYSPRIRKILISFGGGGQYRPMKKLIDILCRHHYEVTLAAGFSLKKNQRKTLKRIYPSIHFVGNTDNLGRAFYQADVAIITSGIAATEAAACGTPALYLYYHSEQQFIASTFQNSGAGLEISKIDDINEKEVIDALQSLTREKRITMGKSGKKRVDGLGACRMIQFLIQQNLIIP